MDIELLSSDGLSTWCERIDIPSAALPALQETAAQIRADGELHAIFAAFYEKTALRGEWQREWAAPEVDPLVSARLGERASQFYLLAFMAALPSTWQKYQQLGISLEIFQATMLDFRYYMQDYFDLHGVWGYATFPWLWRHMTGELYRLGRLQYMLIPFSGGVTALRKRAAGAQDSPEILLLADPDLPLRADGCAWNAGLSPEAKTPPGPDAWTPLFEAGPDGWRGHAVSPYGRVEKQAGFFPATDWEVILQRGDTVLDLHIPRKDPLNAHTCGASYAEALAFFARTFPERPAKALFCHTWMFSPQLQQFLPPSSNVVHFQREFYLYPYAGSPSYLWNFVFGDKYPQRENAPRDTHLRRAVLECLESGGEIFDVPGVLFHAPAEWGTQPYMRRADAAAA
jgi:hypothetical protein